jgi:type I restriction enzyme S subunit
MIKDFSDAFDIGKTSGKAVKKKDYSTEGKFPVVDQGEEFIGGFTNDPSLVINPKKPVIIFGDHTRRLKYIDFPFVPGADGTKILIPKDDLIPKFAFYQLQSIDLRERGYARHFSELRKSSIWVPKSSEQEEIIEFIEDLYSKLRTAEEEAEKVILNTSLFRRSMLHQSFFRRREEN